MSKPSSRTSSPRAMPVETIITRFKSAQQKRQLREMDRSMTKVTELLKNPLKPKIKKKVPLKKSQSSSCIVSVKDNTEEKRSKKNKEKIAEEGSGEFCPLKLKRNVVLNKVRLKPKHDLKIIARTNKRKRSVPVKGMCQSVPESTDMDSQGSRSPEPKRPKALPQDMTMDEMIQLIEDSGSLNDEDLLEILTCPSPVWWEDPPEGYIEDALFTRPRSSAEMYPSVKSQLQENLQERQRSSTPNVLSRRERVFERIPKKEDKQEKDKEESTNDIDLDIVLSKRDEKFIKKRSKLECVLGNLKNKTFKSNDSVKITEKMDDGSRNNDHVSNKVSVIKNLCIDPATKADGRLENDLSSLEDDIVKEKHTVCMETDSECTDDDRLTDISLQDDSFLNDLENMDIPMQIADAPPKEAVQEKNIETVNLPPDVKKNVKDSDFKEPHAKGVRDYIINECSFNKCRAVNYKDRAIDPTYSDKKSSIIEDYFEMKFFEEDEPIVNKKQNEYSKPQFKTFPVTPPKCTKDCKKKDSNLTTSVIKFKNSDNTSINVLKFESVVPKNLPPLKNADKRKGNAGRVPEKLPPLRRNPVIRLNSESPTSKRTKSFETDPYSVMQDNMDSISDTNVCFLNEDEDDCSIDKTMDVLDGTAFSTVIKSSNAIQTNELNPNGSNHTKKNNYSKNASHCTDSVYPPNKIHFAQNVNLYKNLSHLNGVIANKYNELEFQSLTITKVNDNNCCKVEERKVKKKSNNNLINCDKKKYRKTDSIGIREDERTPPKCNEMGQIEKSPERITVYKIVSDDSGNEEPKNESLNKVKSPKAKTKNIQDTSHLKQSKIDTNDKATENSDSNKDKMGFYFKKCKNLYWKHKTSDKIEEKTLTQENEVLNSKPDINSAEDVIDKVNENIKTIDEDKKIVNENNEITLTENNNDVKNKVNHNNNLTDTDAKEKCIQVSNTKQIRYCMKCSSIFDTAQCNYCHRKNGADKKNKCTTDYLLKMEQCFVCDVCRYKALSKDSLERHILSRCCDKHR